MTTPAAIDLPSDDPRHRLSDVVAYQHHDLDPEALAAFETHLLRCPGCQKSVKLAAWAFPALNEVILKELPTPEAQVARLLEPEKGAPVAQPKGGWWGWLQRHPVLLLIPAACTGMVLLWVGPRYGTPLPPTEFAPAPPGVPRLDVRVTAVQTGSISLELAEDPKNAFVVVYAKTPDGSLQRLKPRVTNARSLQLDLQPGSEWLLILQGLGPEEPGGLDPMVMTAVQKDPGINAFPQLPGVARVARLAVPASVP